MLPRLHFVSFWPPLRACLVTRISFSACMVVVDDEVLSARCIWFSINVLPCPSDECALRQRSWDAPGVAREWNTIWKGSLGELDQARLIALKDSHSSDWLFALPITSCGLRLSDEAIWVAVGLRLGLNICEPHTCPCAADVCARGTHGLSCKKVAAGQHSIIKLMT